MITRPDKLKKLLNAAGQQYTISPFDTLYKNMMRQIMLNRYTLDQLGVLNNKKAENNMKGGIINRASVVTMFERPDTDGTLDASFTMRFTGDGQ